MTPDHFHFESEKMSNKIKAIKNIEDKYGAVLFGMALTHLRELRGGDKYRRREL